MRRTVFTATAVCLVVSLLLSLNPVGLAQEASAAADAKPLQAIADSYSFWWSPDGKTLAVFVLNVEKKTGGIMLYDAASGKAGAEIKDGGPSSFSGVGLSFTPDGRALISHSDRVRLYDTADGRRLREFAPGTEPINYYRKIFTGSETSSSTYNPSTGMEEPGSVSTPPSDEDELMELPTRYLSDRVVSPDGKSLLVRAAVRDRRAQVFDLGTGELKFTLEPLPDPGRKKDEGYGDALGEFSPDGKFILTTHRNRTPRVWNAATGALVADLAPHTDRVMGARFSSDSKLVATTSFDDGVVRIWEAATGKLLHAVGSKQDRNYFAAWNPAHNSFVTKTRKWEVNIWDAETGKLLGRLDEKATKEKFDETRAFVYSPDGKLLLTQARNDHSFLANLGVKGGKHRTIAHLWDARTGAFVATLHDNKPRNPSNYRHDKFFWSPAGDTLITAGASIKVWNRRGELLRELEGNAMMRAGLSADGKLLAVIGDEVFRNIWTDFGSVGKILVGKLPKFKAPATYVWQVEDN